jgi:vacuolar protein sorting-associated protein 13A/C
MSDIKLHLTQVQFIVLLNLFHSILHVLEGAPRGAAQVEPATSSGSLSGSHLPEASLTPAADLQPELRGSSSAQGIRSWTALDLSVVVGAVKLHIYDQFATEPDIADHGIARFALNNNNLRLKMLSDSSYEAQLVVKSFTISNTLKGNSKFREIIPAAKHDRNQVMVLYTSSSGAIPSSLAIITVDSPQMILAFDPMFAILDFVMSPFSQESSLADDDQVLDTQSNDQNGQSSGIDFRVDLHDVVVSILENESNADSQAIRLTIKQLSVSQQVLFVNCSGYQKLTYYIRVLPHSLSITWACH